MKLPQQAATAIALLENSGFSAYAVGGWVRDALRGEESHDVDLAASATPNEMKKVFSAFPVVETGLRHGTLTVLIDGVPVEITTFRTEGAYADSRHPNAVHFTARVQDDLARRDFTVNAMAYHPKAGLIDPFGGQTDLQNGVLRCVGDAKTRFSEDALRILRLLRFAATLGFSVEDETMKAALACKERLTLLSKERIAAEVNRMLCGAHIQAVLRNGWEILAVVFPFLTAMHGFEQHNFHHCFDVLEHTAAVVAAAPRVPALRLAAFFHDCGKPDCFSLDENGVGHFYAHAARSAQIAQQTMEALKLDKRTTARVSLLVKLHDAPMEESERAIKRKLNRYGADVLFDLIALQRADTLGLAPEFHSRLAHFDTLEAMTRQVLASKAVFSVRDLAVNGNNLKALGLRGKEIGEALQTLLQAVINEEVENEKEALVGFLQDKGRKEKR